MKAYRKMFVAIGCIGVMAAAAGCAGNEVVKKDEPIAVKQVTAKPAAALGSTAINAPVANKTVVTATAGSDQQSATAMKAAIEKIYFNYNNYDLSTGARSTLTRNADILLKQQQEAKLRIEGNCDERGSAEYNLALGERRAIAAANYLKTLGVTPERISIISYGKERPVDHGHDEAAFAKNRRDEFVIQ